MLDGVCEFIEDKTSFVIGTTLQIGHRTQDAPDRCICVLETAGGSVVPELPDRVDLNIQVIARGLTYFNARDDAWAVYDGIYRDFKTYAAAGFALPAAGGGAGTLTAMTITPLACPQYIGRDEKGRFEFSTNYIFLVKQTNL